MTLMKLMEDSLIFGMSDQGGVVACEITNKPCGPRR